MVNLQIELMQFLFIIVVILIKLNEVKIKNTRKQNNMASGSINEWMDGTTQQLDWVG